MCVYVESLFGTIKSVLVCVDLVKIKTVKYGFEIFMDNHIHVHNRVLFIVFLCSVSLYYVPIKNEFSSTMRRRLNKIISRSISTTNNSRVNAK